MAKRTDALAAEAWRLLFDLLMSTRPQRDAVLTRLDLTPNDSKALASLDEPKPIGALAVEWGTDPSNATWVVDRLERRGLAERRAKPEDRRVKLVALTARGRRTKNAILAAFYQAPPELAALSTTELEQLCAIVRKIPAHRR